MKKVLSAFLGILLVLNMTATCFAYEPVANRIFADRVEAVAGEEISIPVKISGNTGFMGFMILVTADPSVFRPITAQKSDLLNGAFENSIGVSSEDTFRVIYSGTDNNTENGPLFTLKFSVNEDSLGEKEILLSYSSADTFDEKYHDVVLNCETIKVNVIKRTEDNPTDPKEEDKLSVKIRKWWNGLSTVFHYSIAPVVVPLIFVISLFES